MFDVSFSELIVIGAVALVVIGPERLPKVARTVGHLVGRAQRYVNDVKGDIQREMDLDELRNLKDQMEDAARTVQTSMQETGKSLQAPLQEAKDALADASNSIHSAGKPLAGPAEVQETPEDSQKPETTAKPDTSLPAPQAPDMPLAPQAEAPDTQKTLPGFTEASALTEAPKPPHGTPQ